MTDDRSATTIDKRLGQRVRGRRLEIGMSQERLAELIGVTFQQIQKYEKGVNRIACSRLFDIAGALTMPVARFFEGLDAGRALGVAESKSADAFEIMSTPEGAAICAAFGRVKSIKVRRRLASLVEAVAEEGP